MKAVYVCIVSQLCLVSFASVQVSEQPWDTGTLIESIPVEVLVDTEGHETLVTEPIEPATLEQIRDRLPYEVLVWSIGSDGERSPGVSFSNSDTKPNYSPLRRYPGSVVLMLDGSWVIDDVMWSLTHSWVRPGEVLYIPGSEDAQLMIALDDEGEYLEPVHGNRQLVPSIIFTYDSTDAPTDSEDALRVIGRAVSAYRELFRNEDFSVDILFRWEPGLPLTVLANAPLSGRDDRSWNSVRINMQTFYDFNDLDPTETGVYENLPLGSTISYTRSQGSDSTSGIILPLPILTKWHGVGGDTLVIEINPNPFHTSWDFDGTSGIDAASFDFEAVMIHELGHHFGFVCELECLTENSSYDFLSNWDVFRFDDSAGSSISASEMRTATRQLVLNEAALGGTALNSSSRVYELSRGKDSSENGDQASHWFEYAVNDPDYIGIMDATMTNGDAGLVGGNFLQDSDIRAFDIMGYNIDEDFITPPPGTAPLLNPQHNATVPAAALDLDWDSSSNTTTYDVLVFEATPGPGRASTEIWRENDLTATEATIPDGILQPGQDYEWYVVSFNWRGYVISETFAFTTEGGCPADFNNDGVVDTRDMIAFLSAWSAGDPSADFNGDGVVDTRDTIDFLNAWSQGCP